ncbi:hypothetical protein MRX96_017851 [Rhipicephalus microplus]
MMAGEGAIAASSSSDSSEEPTTSTSVYAEQQRTLESSSSKAAGSRKFELGSLDIGTGLSWETTIKGLTRRLVP